MLDKSKLKWMSGKIEEIDNRVSKFWDSPVWENVPVLQTHVGKMYTDCRTKESAFETQIKNIEATLKTKTDYAPFLKPWHGTGVYAQAFGAPYFWKENDYPWTNFAIHSVEEARNIKKPDWRKGEITSMVIDTIKYFKKMVGDSIPISMTDTQSPFDTALLIWESESFFLACYSEPETVHKFLDIITDFKIEFSLIQAKVIGPNIARPGHNAVLSRPWGRASGIGISDDFLVTISPQFYGEFSRPYNEKMADALGGAVIHSCGVWTPKIIPAVLRTRGIMGVELAVAIGGRDMLHLSEACGDPNPNTPEVIRDGFKGSGVPVKARLGDDPLEIIEKIYDPGLIFVPQIMWDEDSKKRDENYEKVHQKIYELHSRNKKLKNT